MSDEKVTAYKGFNKDLRCRGFQFEVGKEYTHAGPVEICKSGFHACENPLDVWNYYQPGSSRFCAVEVSGGIQRHCDDSKVAGANIAIKAEISLSEVISSAAKVITAMCAVSKDAAATTGYRAHAATIGEGAIAAAIGIGGAAKAGRSGAIVIAAHDNNGKLLHVRASMVGESGIKPDVWYRLDERGEFVEVDL